MPIAPADSLLVVVEIVAKAYRDIGWHVYPDHDTRTLRLVQP